MARKRHIAEIMDQEIIDTAAYFTATRHISPRDGYETRQAATLADAVAIGRTMGSRVLIYAVNAAGRSAFVRGV